MAARLLVPALLGISLLLNVVLLTNVGAVEERLGSLQAVGASREDVRTLEHRVSQLQSDLDAVKRATGLVLASEATPDIANGDCDGVPVRFAATFNRLPAQANVTLEMRPIGTYGGAGKLASGTTFDAIEDAPWSSVDATSDGALTFEAVAVLSDVQDHEYRWLARSGDGAIDASRAFVLTLGRDLSHGGTGLGYFSEGDTVRLTVEGGPGTRVCERVERVVVVIEHANGTTDRHEMRRVDDETREWEARVPAWTDARVFIEWHLTDGSIVRQEEASLPRQAYHPVAGKA